MRCRLAARRFLPTAEFVLTGTDWGMGTLRHNQQARPFMSNLADLITDHYERHALAWDADRRAAGWNDMRWIDRFVGLLPPAAAVLDLGCGGGEPVAASMVARGFQVTGVDA